MGLHQGGVPSHRKLMYAAAVLARGEQATFQYLSQVLDAQWWSRDELNHFQAVRLRKLLKHAQARTEYYSQGPKLSVGDDLIGALRELPILEKSALQKYGVSLLSDYPGRRSKKKSGGSTGTPATVLKNADGIAWERAVTGMALSWHDLELGDSVLRFWGRALNGRGRAKAMLSDLAINRVTRSAFELEDADLERHWDAIKTYGPRWIYGYTSVIHRVVRWVESANKEVNLPGLKLVVGTADPMSSLVKADISRVFGVPVQEEYGCSEVGVIAYGCPQGKLHIMSTNVILEIVRSDDTPAQPGELGDVLITDLTNLAMPLIRYRIGDRGAFAPDCSCGLSFPCIEPVEGRISDVLVTPSGELIYGGRIQYHMNTLAKGGAGFTQYQMVQIDRRNVRVNLVQDKSCTHEVVEDVKRLGKTVLQGMSVEVRFVDRIEREPSGKLRLTKTLVDLDAL